MQYAEAECADCIISPDAIIVAHRDSYRIIRVFNTRYMGVDQESGIIVGEKCSRLSFDDSFKAAPVVDIVVVVAELVECSVIILAIRQWQHILDFERRELTITAYC